MQGKKRAIRCLCSGGRIVSTFVVLVFLAFPLCAQEVRWKQECESLFSAAATAEQQDNPIEALIGYERCQEIAHQHHLSQIEASALHRLAVIKARNKKFTESADLFQRAVALDPKNAMILCDFAQLYADRKAYEDAEKLLKNALNLDPNNPKILLSLGYIIASQRSGQETEGLRYLKLAVGEAEAYRILAKVYRSKGDIGQAEFAEQRAKLAESQPTAPSARTTNSVSVRPPQTPPEIVNRVRQELAESETREIIAEAQQQPVTAPAAQKPFIPAPIGMASPEKITVIYSETATDVKVFPFPAAVSSESPFPPVAAPPQSPVDPFASVPRPIIPPATPQQTPPATVQKIPNHSEPLLVVQPSNRSKMLDTITVVQSSEKKSTENNSSEPHLIKITSPAKTDPNSQQRLPVSEEMNRQINVPPIRVLPNGEKRIGQSNRGNPLRQIPPGGAGMIDPNADTPMIASLPSYSAVGIRKISGTHKQDDSPEHSGHTASFVRNVPKAAESQPVALAQPKSVAFALEPAQTPEKNEFVRVPKPAKDVDVLQSPSTVIVRQDLPVSGHGSSPSTPEKKSYSVTSLSATPQKPAMAKPEPQSERKQEYARMIPSGQRFTSTAAPAVLKFGAERSDPPPETNKPVEVASKLPEIHTFPPIVASEARPLMIVKSKVDGTLPVAAAPADPFPVLNDPFTRLVPTEVATIGPQTPAPLALVPVAPPDPFPIVANNSPVTPFPATPKFAEVKKIEPRTSALPELAAMPPVPFHEDDQFGKPKFTEVRTLEPRTPLPMVAAVVPPDPFPVVANDSAAVPKFTEVKNIEPRTPLPMVAVVAPPDPFPIVANDSTAMPKFTEVKTTEPQTPLPTLTAAVSPNPILVADEKSIPPKFAEIKKTESSSPKLLPEVATLPAAMPKEVIVQKTPPVNTLEANTLPLQVAEAKMPDPPPKASAVPVEMPNVVAVQKIPSENTLAKSDPFPKPAETRMPVQNVPEPILAAARPIPIQQPVQVKESIIRPLPAQDESTGFASSRRTIQKIELSEDQSMGFARSRK